MTFTSRFGQAFALTTLSVAGGLLALHAAAAPPAKTSSAKVSATLTIVPTGGTSKVGGYYMPQRMTLSKVKPAHIKKEPKYVGTPQYGIFHFGNAGQNGVLIVVDENADGSEAKIYVDSNHDGDLTNDAAVDWKKQGTAANSLFMGTAAIQPRMARGDIKTGYGVTFYRFSPATSKARGLPPETLLYYRDYASTGEVTLAGKKYAVALLDEGATGYFDAPSAVAPTVITDMEMKKASAPFSISSITPIPANIFNEPLSAPEPDWRSLSAPTKPAVTAPVRRLSLLIDRDGDGKFDSRYERYDVGRPFNIAGSSYDVAKIASDGTRLELKPSKTMVAEVVIPPSFRVGQAALTFTRPSLTGKTISFPSDYKGKVVMLDFWATWCGPCKAELPNLIKVYQKYHDQGFEIVGISLDQENMQAKVADFLKANNMTWSQVCDGKYWKADVAVMYGVDSIPRGYLVDGDTGKIIADGNNLRGPALDGVIAKAVATKTSSRAVAVGTKSGQ